MYVSMINNNTTVKIIKLITFCQESLHGLYNIKSPILKKIFLNIYYNYDKVLPLPLT